MPVMTKPATREIIDDFAKEIQAKKLQTAKPSKAVINFRTDIQDGIEREICRVPSELLRFRKDNGRIASDVLDYETTIGVLDEKDDRSQEVLSKFLEEKDPEKTATLRQSIFHAGQLEPAIITCDGFLINGNRRKMVMDRLHNESPNEENFMYMKVVVLPGRNDPGGPPTLLEIERIENRYQLQSDGKSEYYGFDRALSIKRKIELGLSLEDQLLDDPRYAGMTKSQLDKIVKEFEREYLLPLTCVDRYLKQVRREGCYRTISTGMSDHEGRWQAFKDYAGSYTRTFQNPKRLLEIGIEEDEVGQIEEAAFNIIRLRSIPDMPKVHVIMRNLPKYCSTPEGKAEILKIAEDVEPTLPSSEHFDEHGNPLRTEEVDAKWAAKFKGQITYRVKKASMCHMDQREKDTPIELLEAAYKKLVHGAMDVSAISSEDYGKARSLAADINKRAKELESEIYRLEKNGKKSVKASK